MSRPPAVASPEIEKTDTFGTDDKSNANSTTTHTVPSGAVVESEHGHLYNGVSKIPMWKTYLLVFGLTLMTSNNSGAIQSMNTCVGFIAVQMNFEPQAIQWIVSAYTLSSGCLLLLFIPICTRCGYREVFNFATIVFTAGSIICSAARTPTVFIAGRVVQGVGACSGIPAGLGVLANVLPVIEGSSFRGLAFGVYAAGAPLGSAMGTVFGGLPTGLSAIGWRGTFVVYACLGTLAFLTTVTTMPPNTRQRVPGGPDWIGCILVTLGLTLFLIALSQGPVDGWRAGYVVAFLVVGLLLLPVFVAYEMWLERKKWTPMLRISNFRRGKFGLINLFGFFGFMSYAIWDYLAGIYYLNVHGLDAVQVMLRYLPQTIGGFIGGIAANWLLRKVSTQYVFCAGCLFAALGATIFAVTDINKSYWTSAEFFGFFLSICGACFVYASSILYNISVVVPSEVAAAGGLYQVMTSLAPAIGNVFATILITNQMNKGLPTDRENTAEAYRHGFWFAAGAGYFALIGGIVGLRRIGILGTSGESARVEDLVAHHQEDKVIDGAGKEKVVDAEAVNKPAASA